MAKAKPQELLPKKRFMNGFNILCRSRHPYQVWADAMELFALSFINQSTRIIYMDEASPQKWKDLWQQREDRYLKTIGKYEPKEQKLFPQMLALLVMAANEKQDEDLLGGIYMELGISNNNAGQFFTPYSVSSLMSSLTIDKAALKQAVKDKGWCTINDCTCGAGATLIASIETCKELFNRLDWRNHVLVYANDVDRVCAYMCYLQMVFHDCAAIVTVSNALTQPEVDYYKEPENVFFTPRYISDVWTMRRLFHGFDMMMKPMHNQTASGASGAAKTNKADKSTVKQNKTPKKANKA